MVPSKGRPSISRGVSINATICFTFPQCVAVAEAVERGLHRRQVENQEIASIEPGLHYYGRTPRRLVEGCGGEMRRFIAATNDLCATIRDIMLPNPDDRIGK
jgi:hypothetical protein